MSNFFNFLKTSNSSPLQKKGALLKNYEEEKDVDQFVDCATSLKLQFTQADFEGAPCEKAYLDLLLRLDIVPWKLVFSAVISDDKAMPVIGAELIKKHFQNRFQSQDLEHSVELLSSSLPDQSFLAGWSMIAYAFGPNLHKTRSLNTLLHKIESYFSAALFETRATAFKAWKYLIYNFHLDNHIFSKGTLMCAIWTIST